MVTRMIFVTNPCIHAGVFQVGSKYRVQQKMVDAQTGITLPMLTEVIPERVHALIRVKMPHRVDPTLAQQPLKAFAALWLKEGILEP